MIKLGSPSGVMDVSLSRMVAITGGTGILGMRFIYDLTNQGYPVRVLIRPDSDKDLLFRVLTFYHGSDATALFDLIQFVEGDILDVFSLHDLLEGCDELIHSAAMVSFHPRDADRMYQVNRQGTANVVDVCIPRGVKLLYVSSVAALGRTAGDKVLDETSLWKDSPINSNYAISKYNAELEVWRGIEEGLTALMVNPSIILGAGGTGRSSGTLFGSVLGENPFYTEGLATAVDVRDVSQMALELFEKGISSERFVLHSDQISYKDMFSEMAASLGKRPPTIKASEGLLSFIWRVMAVKDVILRTKSMITKESAQSAKNDFDYRTDKVQNVLGRSFIPVKEAIHYHAAFYSS